MERYVKSPAKTNKEKKGRREREGEKNSGTLRPLHHASNSSVYLNNVQFHGVNFVSANMSHCFYLLDF